MSAITRTTIPIAIVALLLGAAIGYFTSQFTSDPNPNPISRRDVGNDGPKDNARDTPDPASNSGSRGNSTPDPKPPRDTPAPGPNTPKPPEPDADAALREAVARAIAASNDAGKPRGDGVFTGKVTREDNGEPIAGVLIEAWGQPKADEYQPEIRKPIDAKPNPEPDLADLAMKAIKEARGQSRYYYFATTGADGRYTMPGLPEMKFWLSARGPGYEYSMTAGDDGRDPEYGKIKPPMTINFKGTDALDVPVDVLMPDGSAAKPLSITVAKCPEGMESAKPEDAWKAAENGEMRGESWSGPGDVMRMKPGVMLLYAQPDDRHGMVKAEAVVARIGEVSGAANAKIVIQLKAVPGITVKVKDESGDSTFGYFETLCAPCPDGVLPGLRELRALGVNSAYSSGYGGWGRMNSWGGYRGGRSMELYNGPISYSDYYPGYYGNNDEEEGVTTSHFRDLTAGPYVVALVRREEIVAHAMVSVAGVAVVVNLVLPPARRDEYAKIWVKGPDGELMASGVNFEARFANENRSESSGGGTRQADGSWTVPYPGMSREDVANLQGTWTIKVHHKDYGERTVTMNRGAADEVTVNFDQPGFLLVTVDGLEGHAAKDKIFLGEESGGDYWSSHGQIRPVNGVFKVGPMQAREVKVVLRIRGDNWWGIELATATATVGRGESSLRMSMPALYSVTVSVSGAQAGSSVSLSRERVYSHESNGNREEYTTSDQVASSAIDRNGIVKFEHLPAGKYTAYVHDDQGRFPAVEFQLPGAGTINIAPEK